MLENSRRTRLYFDEGSEDWNRMPLSWERNVPEVEEMLMAIDEALPDWQNVDEQVQHLLLCIAAHFRVQLYQSGLL